MACPPVGNGSCYNQKFKTTITPGNPTGFNYLYNFEKVFNKSTTLTWYYVIGTDYIVKYKVIRITKLSNGGTSKSNPLYYNTLQEFANNPPVVSLDPFDNSRATISRIVNTIKSEMDKILKKNLSRPLNATQSTPTATRQNRTPSPPTAPRATGASSPQSSSTGTASSTQQAPAIAPTTGGATGAITSLQDSGYLNTSSPKDFPLINQPNGQYKPISEVSRFVFDAALPSSPLDLEREYKLETTSTSDEDNRTSGRYSNTNRKRFGANLAVLNKLESVEFHEGKVSDEKRDYIAYLIPYGSPGIDSNSSSTISTQVPVPKPILIGPNKIPGADSSAGDAKKISDKNPEAFELYKSAKILEAIRDDIKLTREELIKVFTAEWNSTINEKKFSLIVDAIDKIYNQENYPKNKNDIIKNKLRLQPLLYKKIISNLERDFDSLDKKIPGEYTKFQANFAAYEITSADIKSTSFKIDKPDSIEAFNNFLSPENLDSKNITYGTYLGDAFKTITVTGKNADPIESSKKDAGTSGIDPSLKVWQFLYNPQSISIDVKADYAESNTWGATDDGQSGQSLVWQRNKNPVMRLDEIVLNGYIHGKKVGQLEEGLFALLMSRDGVGQIEPTVWEFVWGKRRFGPCIINNIQVVEKQWEAGEVLTATVSFELTQIPKWQIIDSTVKFYDPTAMATFASEPTGTGSEAPGGGGGGGGGGNNNAASALSDSPGGLGQGDPCRAEFNKVIDSSEQKIIKTFLFECSKRASVDLYRDTNIDKLDPLLNKISDACSKKNGNKNPIILTKEQRDKYIYEGRKTLKEAAKKRFNCINDSAVRNSSNKPTAEQLMTLLDNIRQREGDNGNWNFIGDNSEAFIKDYETIFNRVYRFTRSEDLGKDLDTIAYILINQGINKKENWSKGKCVPSDIRNRTKTKNFGFLALDNKVAYASASVRTCYQFLWLYVVGRMSFYKLAIDPSKVSFVYGNPIFGQGANTRFFIRITSRDSSLSFPKALSIESGSKKVNFKLPGFST